MSRIFRLSACAALLATTALTSAGLTSAHAADLPSTKMAPLAPIMTQWSPWMIRGRALFVVPQESAKLKLGGAPIVGGDVNISNSVVPELDISYFFTKNIAVELILGVTPHNVKGAGALAGARIGSAWLLPPGLSQSLISTRSTCGMARATRLASARGRWPA